uniref:Uncharacterized protein n=1 Tax=Arundo donax TaxID=35708 RepID=A0A0A8Y6M0_ARUDO
MHYILEYLHIH